MCALINPILGEIRGSIKGITGSRTRGGSVLRGKTSGVQPRTTAQTTVRAVMAGLSKKWGSILTSEQRTAWNNLAEGVVLYNVFGDPYNATGYMLFCRLNQNRATFGDTILLDAPADLNVTTLDTLSISDLPAPDGFVNLTWTPAIQAYERVLCRGVVNTSPGVTSVAGKYLAFDYTALGGTSPSDFVWDGSQLLARTGGKALWGGNVAGLVSHFWAQVYNENNGVLSPGITISGVAVTPP